MPCRYDPSDAEIAAAAELSMKNQRDVLNKINTLTRMLCRVLGQIWDSGQTGLNASGIDPDIQEWYKEHRKLDAKRKEQLRKDVLAKLTDEEKEALGL